MLISFEGMVLVICKLIADSWKTRANWKVIRKIAQDENHGNL